MALVNNLSEHWSRINYPVLVFCCDQRTPVVLITSVTTLSYSPITILCLLLSSPITPLCPILLTLPLRHSGPLIIPLSVSASCAGDNTKHYIITHPHSASSLPSIRWSTQARGTRQYYSMFIVKILQIIMINIIFLCKGALF